MKWKGADMQVRNKQVLFLVNDHERELIMKKMQDAGLSNISAYLRKMAIDGYMVNLDLSEMKEAIRLLRIMSNNLNQYAKKANETGRIYAEDIADIKAGQEEIWKTLKTLLRKLSGL